MVIAGGDGTCQARPQARWSRPSVIIVWATSPV
jgi:hypothetical protein